MKHPRWEFTSEQLVELALIIAPFIFGAGIVVGKWLAS